MTVELPYIKQALNGDLTGNGFNAYKFIIFISSWSSHWMKLALNFICVFQCAVCLSVFPLLGFVFYNVFVSIYMPFISCCSRVIFTSITYLPLQDQLLLYCLPLQDQLLSYYMKDHPLFSENLVNYLVNEFLDEIIIDILTEALGEIGKLVCI